MRYAILTISLVLLLGSQPRGAQQESARDIFLDSRKPSQEPTKSPPGQNPPSAGNTQKPPSSAGTTAGRSGTGRRPPSRPRPRQDVYVVASNTERVVGLGYTLFLKDGPDRLVHVRPSRVFYTNQAIRLLIESNINGYLYIFHQANDGRPKMLFPSWLVREGDNRIWAHEPVMIPSAKSAEFVFTKDPAIETLTIVVSRDPISDLPTGKTLQGAGRVILSDSLFEDITHPCKCRESAQAVEGQTVALADAGRDIELRASDPEPAYIYVNEDRSQKRLSVRLQLVHK
jgi:hypothetical protein